MAATAVIISGIVPPQAAASPGWRQVHSQHYGPASDYSIYGAVVASAKNSAWVLGGSDVSGGNGTSQHPVATHWNGKSWGGYTLPSGMTSNIIAASAPSASDIWAVTGLGGYVLHWNGSRWVVAKRLPDNGGELTGVTALSATNVWVFGGGGAYPGLGTWHYNGKSWQQWKGSAAGLERASALSANSIWAVGSGASIDSTIQHFNGKAWQTVSAKALSGLQFSGIRAFSNTNIWVSTVAQGGQPGYLVHFNGASWTRIKVPWSAVVNNPVSDGHGGLWLTGLSASTGQSYVIHRTSAGAWSRTPLSVGLDGLALIPGTSSLWAVGAKPTSTNGDAVIWAYGSV